MSIIITIHDFSSFMMIRRFYSHNYRLSNDILQRDSSEFVLDVTEEESYQIEPDMREGNIVFGEYPESIFQMDVAVPYMGILRKYDRETKTISVDHYYTLFNNDSVPLQVNKNKTTLKNRLVYEWLPMVLNGVVYTAEGKEFRYHENYDIYKKDDGHSLYLEKHQAFVIDEVLDAKTGDFGTSKPYIMNKEEDTNTGGILDMLDYGVAHEHLIVTPRYVNHWKLESPSSAILNGDISNYWYTDTDLNEQKPREIHFNVGQFLNNSMADLEYTPFSFEPDNQGHLRLFLIFKRNGKYEIWKGKTLLDDYPYFQSAKDYSYRYRHVNTGLSGYEVKTITYGKYKMINDMYDEYNDSLAYEDFKTKTTTANQIAIWIPYALAWHLFYNFLYPRKAGTSLHGYYPDFMWPELSNVVTIGDFDVDSYSWPSLISEHLEWEYLTTVDDLRLIVSSGKTYKTADEMPCLFGNIDFNNVIKHSTLTKKTETVLEEYASLSKNTLLTGFYIMVRDFNKHGKTTYWRDIYQDITSQETIPFYKERFEVLYDYNSSHIQYGFALFMGEHGFASNKHFRVKFSTNERASSIYNGLYILPESNGKAHLYISEYWSFVKSVSVEEDKEKVNAVYFYDDYVSGDMDSEEDMTKKLPQNAKTHSRCYLTTENKIVQVALGFSPYEGQPVVTEQTLLDVPQNVEEPLRIKHVVMSYDTEDDETGEKITLNETEKLRQEREYAKSELTETADSTTKIVVELYENDIFRFVDLRVGMLATIYTKKLLYEGMLLTGIEKDTSNDYYTLTFGAFRSDIYRILNPVKKKKR